MEHKGLPAGIVLVKMLVGAGSMLVCAKTGVIMTIELRLIGQRPIDFRR